VTYRNIENEPKAVNGGSLEPVLPGIPPSNNGRPNSFWLGYVDGKPVFQVDGQFQYNNLDLGFPVLIDGSTNGATLTIDYTGGTLFPSIDFNGGGKPSSSLLLRSGKFTSEDFNATEATSGNLALDGISITYEGVAFVSDLTTAGDFTFNATDAGEDIHLTDGSWQNGVYTNKITSGTTGSFAPMEFANKDRVDINALGGADTITSECRTSATGLFELHFYGGDGNDTIYMRGVSPYFGSFVAPGEGDNALYVVRSNNFLEVDGAGSHDSVTLGTDGTSRPSLANVQGAIGIFGSPMSTDLNINYLWDGGKKVTVNDDGIQGLGASLTYDAASLRSLTVQGAFGSNSFAVNDTPNNPIFPITSLYGSFGSDTFTVSGTTGRLNIYGGGGQDSVNLGVDDFEQHTADKLLGWITMSNTFFGSTALSLDDAFGLPRTLTVSPTSLTGLGAGEIIDYGGANLRSLTISGSVGGNTFNVTGTPSSRYATATTLYTGYGSDRVNVAATSGPLTINGGNGADTVTIGGGPGGIFGLTSLYGIQGPVTITNDLGSTALTLDDSFGSSKYATLSANALTGMSRGDIHFTPSALQSLTIIGGYQGNTFNVLTTPNNPHAPVTTLKTGASSDRVAVAGTLGELQLDGAGGADTVTIGNLPVGGTAYWLYGIQGAVTVRNTQGTTNLTVQDGGDSTSRPSVNISTVVSGAETFGRLTGLSNYAPISYRINDGSGKTDLAALTINAGSYGNTISINNADPAGNTPFLTTLNSGNGNDTVNVWAVSANNPLQLNGQGGMDQFRVVPGAASVTVDGGAPTSGLPGDFLDYYGSGSVTHTGPGSGRITQSGVATVNYSGIEVLEAVGGTLTDIIDAGSQANDHVADIFRVVREGQSISVYVNGRYIFGVGDLFKDALQLNGSGDNDTLIVDGSGGNPTPAGGLKFDGMGGVNTMLFNDQTNTADSTWQISDQSVTRSYTVTGFFGPATISASVTYANVQSLTVNAGSGNDGIDVQSLSAGTTVNAGVGNDTVTAGAGSNNLDYLARALTVNGGTGSDLLNINDQANNIGSTYTATATSVRRQNWVSSVTMNYSGFERLALNTGLRNDQVSLAGVAIPAAVATGNGDDTVVLSPWGGAFGTVPPPVSVDGGIGSNWLVISDQNNLVGGSYTITTAAVTRTVGVTTTAVNYTGISRLVLTTGIGPDRVNVESTPGATAVSTGDGADTVTVAAQARSLDVIQGLLTVNGGTGVNQLQVNDQNNYQPSTWELTGTSIDRTALPPSMAPVHDGLTYSNIKALTVNTGNGDETINVRGTSADTILNPGAGLTTVNVGNLANSLDDLHGTLTVPAAYILQINDQGASHYQSYTVTAGSVTRNTSRINYGSVLALTLNGGSGGGSSSFAIQGTSASQTFVITGTGADSVTITGNATGVSLWVYGGGGADDVFLGNGTLGGLLGGISIPDNAHHLTIDDRFDTTHRSPKISDYTSTGLFPGNVSYAALSEDYYLGTGGNDVDLTSVSAVGQLTIHGNTGVDTIKVEIGHDLYPHTVRVEGQGNDSLTIDDTARTDNAQYTVTDSSVARTFPITTTVQFVGVGKVKMLGSQGDDVFAVVSSPAATMLALDGGAGNNTLDYSAYPTGVTVNLATGQATGFAGGISNIANVLGSAFADRLTGNAGRNVLIGGPGADILDGGDGDDLLIGGSTTYGANTAAVLAIVREWARTDASYSTRIAHLSNGGGLNGTYVLNATTLRDDGVADTFTGGPGSDWFLGNANQDVFTDGTP
jgi:acrosin